MPLNAAWPTAGGKTHARALAAATKPRPQGGPMTRSCKASSARCERAAHCCARAFVYDSCVHVCVGRSLCVCLDKARCCV